MYKLPEWLKKSKWRYVIGGFVLLIGAILFVILPIGPGSLIIIFGLYIMNSEWTHKKFKRFFSKKKGKTWHENSKKKPSKKENPKNRK